MIAIARGLRVTEVKGSEGALPKVAIGLTIVLSPAWQQLLLSLRDHTLILQASSQHYVVSTQVRSVRLPFPRGWLVLGLGIMGPSRSWYLQPFHRARQYTDDGS